VVEFYFIVSILFIFDSFVWVKNYSIGLHSFIGFNFRVKKKGIYFLNFLPTTQYFNLERSQFILAKDGLFILNKLIKYEKTHLVDTDFSYMYYRDIQKIEKSGGVLLINDSIKIITHSKSVLNKSFNILNSIIQEKPARRFSLVKNHYSKAGALKMIESQTKYLRKALLFLEPLGLVFFMILFILFPLTFFGLLSLPISTINLFIVLGGIHLIVITIVLFIYYRKTIKNFDLSYLIPILLYPLSSAHLISNIFRDIFCNYDSLSVMSVFLKENDFISIARNDFNKNIISKESSTNSNYIEYLSSKNEKIKSIFLEKNISLDRLTSDPIKIDESSISYCPVCECEYLIKSGVCADCKVALRQYIS